MCRSACDGNDYRDQYGYKGNVTHNTENPWDGDSSNSWDDGGQHTWDKENPVACECNMKVAATDTAPILSGNEAKVGEV